MSKLAGKDFAYDRVMSKPSSTTTEPRWKSSPHQSKTFKVEISFAAKISMQAIAHALRNQESQDSQETPQ